MQLLDIVSLFTVDVEICYNGHTTFMLSELYVHNINIIKSVTVMYNSLINTNVICTTVSREVINKCIANNNII